VFAGQVLALQLSVDFSRTGRTQQGLGSLVLGSGPLAGYTVDQVLALANAVLGGSLSALPPGLSVSGLNGIVDKLNRNFDDGDENLGYVYAPGCGTNANQPPHFDGDGDDHDRNRRGHRDGDGCDHDRTARRHYDGDGDGDDHDRRRNGHYDGDGCDHDGLRSWGRWWSLAAAPSRRFST
jgi:hypothetical protein